MKYDKNKPLYIHVMASNGQKKVVTSLFAARAWLQKIGASNAWVRSVQKVDGQWQEVEGKSKKIIIGVISSDN